ncbi:MAG: DUF3500 domain-containing protein [Planctomycetes bacterium]|nr:DUF3500 domain-containing protein [Planctomycetota bacterium]
MKLFRLLLAGTVLAGLVGVALVGRSAEQPAAKMATAAEKFLATLSAEQKDKTVYAFDSKERTNWFFIPLQTPDKKSTRKGLPIEEMTAEQKDAARELLRAGTSASSYTKATTIMSLESILHDLEKGGSMVRNPGWYFFTLFGTPSKTGQWGWRVEGHHLSLNFTLDKGKIVSATPNFFGANPATIQQGRRKGARTLPEAEELAKELFNALDDDQKKVALQDKQFPEIEQGKAKPNVGPARGLPASKMNKQQKGILLKLVASYADRMPEEVGRFEMDKVEKAGTDKIHFAFAQEEDKRGKPYTYRVQGPTFVIEFLNVQNDSAGNPANHIHSAWRNLQGDFGLEGD